MSDAEGASHRRRRRSRSRRHHHRHRRHSSVAEAKEDAGIDRRSGPPGPPQHGGGPPRGGGWGVEYPPPPGHGGPWRVAPGTAPPVGWHGTTGTGAPPPGPAGFSGSAPGGPGSGPPLAGRPPPMPHMVADLRYEVIRESPYGHPLGGGAMVPPPAGLSDGLYGGGRGRWKGKGRGGGAFFFEEARPSLPDGLVVSNVPADLCTLSVLNRHFRQFGEVVRITVQAGDGKAFVQFAEHSSAAAALPVPVLDRKEIVLTRAPRGQPKAKGGKAAGKEGKGGKMDGKFGGMAENMVLDNTLPQEDKELRQKRDDIAARKASLLGGLTEQMKRVMSKMTDKNLDEAQREKLRTLAVSIKAKMDKLTSPRISKGAGKVSADGSGNAGSEAVTTPRHKGKGSSGKFAQFALDLRSKALRLRMPEGWTLERLRGELKKSAVADDQVQEIAWHMGADGAESPEFSIVRFRDRRSAEQLFSLKAGLPFSVEWHQSPPPAAGSPPTSPLSAFRLPPSVAMSLQPGAADAEEKKDSKGTDSAEAPTGGGTRTTLLASAEQATAGVAPVEGTSGEGGASESPSAAVAPEAAGVPATNAPDASAATLEADGATEAPPWAEVNLSEEEDADIPPA